MKRLVPFFLMLIMVSYTASAQDYDMQNLQRPSETIVTGGQHSLADIAHFKADGITTIINLRGSREFDQATTRLKSKEAGIAYYNFPVSGRSEISLANAKRVDALLKKVSGKTLIHCGSGNRVGGIMAIRAHLIEGKSREEALALGRSIGMSGGTEEQVLTVFDQ